MLTPAHLSAPCPPHPAEQYEHAYNFRFEEPGGATIVTHPRNVRRLPGHTVPRASASGVPQQHYLLAFQLSELLLPIFSPHPALVACCAHPPASPPAPISAVAACCRPAD